MKKSLAAPPGRNPVVEDAGKAGRADDRPTAGGTAPTIDDEIDWYALSNGIPTVMPDGTLVDPDL